MKKVIIFTNADWHFYAHLLPIAIAAKNSGYNVKILTNISNYQKKIEQHGFEVIPIKINRSSINPFINLVFLFKIAKILFHEQPDILNNFTMKPIIFGSIISLFCKRTKIVNIFLGLGLLFMSHNILIKFIKQLIVKILVIISFCKKMTFVVQNKDDRDLLINSGISAKLIITQCAVGINTADFPLLPVKDGKTIFALVARMIIDKGINEFIEAAKILKNKNIEAEFWLVGEPDIESKKNIDLSTLKFHHDQGYIKYIGFKQNIKKIWQAAHVAVLPSYREGLSRSLLEAGAYGRAIITTDAPGGRELVQDKVNGLLVQTHDSANLAQAMEDLHMNVNLREKLAINMRKNIIDNYDAKIIANKIIELYV